MKTINTPQFSSMMSLISFLIFVIVFIVSTMKTTSRKKLIWMTTFQLAMEKSNLMTLVMKMKTRIMKTVTGEKKSSQ